MFAEKTCYKLTMFFQKTIITRNFLVIFELPELGSYTL